MRIHVTGIYRSGVGYLAYVLHTMFPSYHFPYKTVNHKVKVEEPCITYYQHDLRDLMDEDNVDGIYYVAIGRDPRYVMTSEKDCGHYAFDNGLFADANSRNYALRRYYRAFDMAVCAKTTYEALIRDPNECVLDLGLEPEQWYDWTLPVPEEYAHIAKGSGFMPRTLSNQDKWQVKRQLILDKWLEKVVFKHWYGSGYHTKRS